VKCTLPCGLKNFRKCLPAFPFLLHFYPSILYNLKSVIEEINSARGVTFPPSKLEIIYIIIFFYFFFIYIFFLFIFFYIYIYFFFLFFCYCCCRWHELKLVLLLREGGFVSYRSKQKKKKGGEFFPPMILT